CWPYLAGLLAVRAGRWLTRAGLGGSRLACGAPSRRFLAATLEALLEGCHEINDIFAARTGGRVVLVRLDPATLGFHLAGNKLAQGALIMILEGPGIKGRGLFLDERGRH